MLVLTDWDYDIYCCKHFLKTKTIILVVDSNDHGCNYIKVFSIALIKMTVHIFMAMIMPVNKF